MQHPRLALLQQDERVRSFKILTTKKQQLNNSNKTAGNKLMFPSRLWYSNLDTTGRFKATTRAPVGNTKNIRWDILTHDTGTLNYTLLVNSNIVSSSTLINNSTSNSWHTVAINTTNLFFTPSLLLQSSSGNMDVDLCVLNAGESLDITKNKQITFPASSLFHGGYSDSDQQHITFLKEYEPASPILYGSLIKLPVGTYTLRAEIETGATAGTVLGTMRALKRKTIIAEQPVIAGTINLLEFIQQDQFPVRIEFKYNATTDISIGNIELRHKY